MEKKEFGIYVHIPFCISKCKYCDFNSYANMNDKVIQEYIDRLVKEIQDSKYFKEKYICKTIYFGGGTPSYIDEKYIEKILKQIKAEYYLANDCEITIELNPCSVTENKLRKYKELGFNRLSIGLQTTNNERLELIGRKHTYEMFKEKYDLARKIGFNNINVDLMLALPNETLDDVEKDIQEIINLNPEHISCYSLIIYENTPMYELAKKCIMPNEDDERQMYHLIQKSLQDNGYIQYEISNFAKENMYSRHNMMCWKQYEYIGFGAGASSFVGNMRFKNVDNISKYIAENESIIEEEMSVDDAINEYMLLGFRLIDGINIEEINKKFNIDVLDRYKEILEKLEKDGLIQIKENKIYPTQLGIDCNNEIGMQFV